LQCRRPHNEAAEAAEEVEEERPRPVAAAEAIRRGAEEELIAHRVTLKHNALIREAAVPKPAAATGAATPTSTGTRTPIAT
jgi:hypothetical protein